MATAEVTVIGLGRQSASASEYIAEMQRRLQAQDKVRFKLHAMGTELEGKVEDILEVVRVLHNVPFEAGLPASTRSSSSTSGWTSPLRRSTTRSSRSRTNSAASAAPSAAIDRS